MRIAMVSGHASPLAAPGQNAVGLHLHVAEQAAALAAEGHEVRVYTRRDDVTLPDTVPTDAGYQVWHVPAGPARPVPAEELLPHLGEFGRWLTAHWQQAGWRPDVAHAHFWLSGLAAVHAGRRTGTPVVLTYHDLGSAYRRRHGGREPAGRGRIGYERALGRAVDRVVVQSHDELGELVRLGVPRARLALVPSGVDERLFTPSGPAAPRVAGRPRLLTVGPLHERRGVQDVVRALPGVPGAEYVVVGGRRPGRCRPTTWPAG